MTPRRSLLPLLLATTLLSLGACSQGSDAAGSAAATTASSTTAALQSTSAEAAPSPTAEPTPSATPSSAPAPSLDTLRNATLQLPEGCKADTPVTFADGLYTSEPGVSYFDVRMADAGDAVVTVNGTQARAVAFSCAAGDGAGGAIGLYDADLKLIGQHAMQPLGSDVTDSVLAAAVPSTEMNWYPVALATGSTPGSLHATWSAYGQMADSDAAFPAGSTLDDLEADLTWKGSDVTVSDPVLHSPLVTLTSVIDQLHAGTSPSQISAIDPGAVEALTSQDLPIDGKSSADLLSTMGVTDTGSCQAGDDVAETTGADAAASTTFICTISGGGQGELGVSVTARRDAPGQYVLTYLHVITG